MVEKFSEANLAQEVSGRELACYLLLSELLRTLVTQQLLDQESLEHILWTAGMRLYCIRCDLIEMGSPVDVKRLESEGLSLLNLIDDDIRLVLARSSRKRRHA